MSGNWYPHTPSLAGGNWYNSCGEQSGVTSRGHQSAYSQWLTLTSQSSSQDNNQKRRKIIHEGIMRGLFSNGEKLELYKPEVGELKGLDSNFFCFYDACSICLLCSTFPWTKLWIYNFVWLGSNKFLWKLEFKFHIISASHEILFFWFPFQHLNT